MFWERWTAAAFLRAYREAVSGSGLAPGDDNGFRRMLDVLLLDKALYELTLSEAAYIAALPKGPNNYHPCRRPK